jgi:hypothetical protein
VNQTAVTLTVAGGGSYGGVIQDGNSNNTVALIVGGTNKTLILSGNSTYSGATTINNTDTLLVNGSETSPVLVQGTLGGTGTTGQLFVAGGGEVNPGSPVNSTGTLTAASADFSNNGNLTVNVTGSPANISSDLLSVTGAVTLGGTSTLTVDLNGLTSAAGPITIVSDGSQTGQFSSVNIVNNPNNFQVSVTYTNTSVILNIVPGNPPPIITNVVINQDISALYNAAGQPSPGVQRSMVSDIVYTFSEPVNILSSATDPNVFTVAVAAGWTGTVPALDWTPVVGSGNAEWAVTFSGNGLDGGSIANGAYTITVNHPAAITAVSDSQVLSLSASGIGSATQSFYRLYGDINGDEIVNAFDNLRFKNALTVYNQAFDFNGDGVVNAADNLRFKQDLTVNFTGFTPTI